PDGTRVFAPVPRVERHENIAIATRTRCGRRGWRGGPGGRGARWRGSAARRRRGQIGLARRLRYGLTLYRWDGGFVGLLGELLQHVCERIGILGVHERQEWVLRHLGIQVEHQSVLIFPDRFQRKDLRRHRLLEVEHHAHHVWP